MISKFFLPKLEWIKIENYSLFKCPLEIKFNKRLNIIFGTNGTGKSSLLHIIIYSIIGPYIGDVKVKTILMERRDNRPMLPDSFFKDRMINIDENAKVTCCFFIDKTKFVVVHSLYDNKLIEVKVNDVNLEGAIVTYKTYETNSYKVGKVLDEYLIGQYQNKLSEKLNMPGGVNTLINMLLDVMFFSEDRKYTFWQPSLQEMIVGKYIVDSEFYENFEETKRQSKYLESLYKKESETLNYFIKLLDKEKEKEDKVISNNDSYEERLKRYNELDIEIEDILFEFKKTDIEYKKCVEKTLELRRNIENLKDKLENLNSLWYKNLFPDSYNLFFKKFIKTMTNSECPLCGNRHSFNIKTENCVFCGEKLSVNKNVDMIELDISRRDTQIELTNINKEFNIHNEYVQSITNKINMLQKKREKLDMEKNMLQINLETSKKNNSNAIDQDEERISIMKKNKASALHELNVNKENEYRMRKEIESKMVLNFRYFANCFEMFSNSFFGENNKATIELPILPTNDNEDISLFAFKLNGKKRDKSYTLSESQRIFTDLSFRFSILKTFHYLSFLICETPDSTLDFFHEENAVKTFNKYIEAGNMLILTANARKNRLISNLYNIYEKNNETNVIDLNKLSSLALKDTDNNNLVSFEKYLGGTFNE